MKWWIAVTVTALVFLLNGPMVLVAFITGLVAMDTKHTAQQIDEARKRLKRL